MLSKMIKKRTRQVWWLTILTGILSVAFGLTALLWPGITLTALITIFLIFVLILGVVALVESLFSIGSDPLWWLGLLFSIVSIGIGVFLISNPGVTIEVFIIFLAVFVFAQSLMDLVIASYAGENDGKWMWIVSGILGVIFGFVIVLYPEGASLAFVWVLGLYALLQGVISIVYAIRFRHDVKKLKSGAKKAKKSKK